MIKINIIPATITDYPIMQNMARFYVYDISRHCGFISKRWALPQNGLYQCFDLKKYFIDADKKAYLVKLDDDELVGFVLLDKQSTSIDIDWNMGEFFVLAKFQGKGIGAKLMAAAEKCAQDNGCNLIELLTLNRRRKDGTHNFYEKLGFKDQDKAELTYFSKIMKDGLL